MNAARVRLFGAVVGAVLLVGGILGARWLWTGRADERGTPRERIGSGVGETAMSGFRQMLADRITCRGLLSDSNRISRAAWPPNALALDQWIVAARNVLGRADRHRARLEEIISASARQDSSVAESSGGGSSRLIRRNGLEQELESWEERLRSHPDESDDIVLEIGFLRRRLAEDAFFVEVSDGGIRSDKLDLKIEYSTLVDLVPSLGSIRAQLEWIELRRKCAAELTVCKDEYDAAWRAAIASITSDPTYRNLAIRPQDGLWPIAVSEAGLWEFMVLGTGERLQASGGRRSVVDESGVVLVLLPGGSFAFGEGAAESSDAHGHFTISPFFLSKYEITQAQWWRIMGRNSSFFQFDDKEGKSMTGANPVECVDFEECRQFCERIGASLPSEAQWEYACRSSTAPPTVDGIDSDAILASENLRPEVAKQRGTREERTTERPRRVGLGLGNRFGLFDMHGNVAEWCLDRREVHSHPYGVTFATRDRESGELVYHLEAIAVRGGAYDLTREFAEPASRSYLLRHESLRSCGLRPARRLNP